MSNYDKLPGMNTSRRFPIVFCLDVSPSMGWRVGNNSSSIELLNAAVSSFVADLKNFPRAKACAEIAFVTFGTHIEEDTKFEPLARLTPPTFKPVDQGGTKMAQAVLRSIEKIEKRRKELENQETPYYAPFLVLVTDGNPDNNDDKVLQDKALAAVKQHCDSHVGASEIIVPFIIGVGDHISPATLTSYSAGFIDGYFPIKGSNEKAKEHFSKVFQLIGNSVKKSIHLNDRNVKGTEIISTTRQNMRETMEDLFQE